MKGNGKLLSYRDNVWIDLCPFDEILYIKIF